MSMTLIQEKNQYAIHAYDTGSKKKIHACDSTNLELLTVLNLKGNKSEESIRFSKPFRK